MHLIRKVLPNKEYKIYQLCHSCQDARFILRRQIRTVCYIKNKSQCWKLRDLTSNMKKVFSCLITKNCPDVDQKAPVKLQSLMMLMPTWAHKRLVWHPAAVL